MALSKECEGEFCSCTEDLKEYRVISNTGFDWGTFTYCEAHRDIDIEAGFEVKEV